jgi:hypothetical protein
MNVCVGRGGGRGSREGGCAAPSYKLSCVWLQRQCCHRCPPPPTHVVGAASTHAPTHTHTHCVHAPTQPPAKDAVDPAYGNEELAAARRQAARLTHAAAALARQQEALVGELERAVEKRELIATKVGLAPCSAESLHISQAAAWAEPQQPVCCAACNSRDGPFTLATGPCAADWRPLWRPLWRPPLCVVVVCRLRSLLSLPCIDPSKHSALPPSLPHTYARSPLAPTPPPLYSSPPCPQARLAQSQRIQDMTASQARRASQELARAAARAQREAQAAEGRLELLGERALAAQVNTRCMHASGKGRE